MRWGPRTGCVGVHGVGVSGVRVPSWMRWGPELDASGSHGVGVPNWMRRGPMALAKGSSTKEVHRWSHCLLLGLLPRVREVWDNPGVSSEHGGLV